MNYLVTLIGLFIVLSPGLLLSIPALSDTEVASRGIASGTTNTGGTLCAANSTNAACTKATSIWNSMQTSVPAAAVHAIVFAAVVWVFQSQMPQYGSLSVQNILLVAIVFGVLSPGVLLTLPSLSQKECGLGNRNVSETGAAGSREFCDAITDPLTKADHPNCYKCTKFWNSEFSSPLAIIVHSIVFGVVIYWLSTNVIGTGSSSGRMAMRPLDVLASPPRA